MSILIACTEDPPSAPQGAIMLSLLSIPTLGVQVKYKCGGINQNEFLTSTCETSTGWTEIEGVCPELDEDPDLLYTGNYQIGREHYNEEDEEQENGDELLEGKRGASLIELNALVLFNYGEIT